MSEPTAKAPMRDGFPELDVQGYSVHRLMCELLQEKIPLPIWLRMDRTAQLITTDNVRDVCRGMLLALELRDPTMREG